MIKRDLKDNFQISISGQDTWYDMNVPGSAMETFCKEGILPDPYYGMNEYKWTEFWKNDFDIRSAFSVSAEEIASEEILLTFYGIDTVADVFLNGKKLGHTENMHRTWVYQVKELVKEGENLLELHIASPVKFIETYKPEKGREIHFTNTGTTSGSQYIRKAHSMFGWDWGPKLPDAGLFRGVELCCFDTARLGESLIRQEHMDGAVTLHIGSEIEKADGQVVKAGNTAMQSNGNSAAQPESGGSAQPGVSGLQLFYELRDPSSALIYTGTDSDINVTNPALWWPNGYGKQPLYTLTIQLKAGETVLDTREYRIGLRTVTVSREDDQWGQEFAIMVNGVKIFARGADYIPDDCFYPRITREILERDVKACVFANFNCLRVWGGGYYPSDEFYDLCDEYGILLWEDLMYACNIYDVTPEFAENIAIEAKDNILRFRNHACLGLICGNYKALHYMAKGFCDNVAGSIEKKETHMGFWISNETLDPVTVKAKIAVKTLDFQVIEEQEVSKEVPALSAECLFEKEYKELIAGRDDSVFFVVEYEYEQNGQKVSKKEFETFVPVKYLELKDPAFKVTENADGSVSIQTDTFVPYCMLEGISADTIWNENVVAFTDKEAVTLVPVENQKISRDGVRIYDIYHTYH